jgi:sugar phosphate permease
MNRQFLISGIVMSILALAFGGVIHGGLLAADYTALGSMMRTPEDAANYFQWQIVAHIFMGFAMTWIYRQGVDPAQPTLIQGVRFGLAVVCLFIVPMFLIYYAVAPFPGTLVVKQIAFETVATTILGVATAYLNRPPATA